MPLPLANNDQAVGIGLDASGLPLRRVIIDGSDPSNLPDVGDPAISDGGRVSDGSPTLNTIVDKLLGTNGQQRYQFWPERLIRDALAAPHDTLNSDVPVTSADLIKPALDVSALAGTGGLAGAGEDAGAAALGAGPFLRPALKYQGKIYKAPVGGQHMDAIPADLQPEFTRQAMNGEDISNFNFGFMNHKGHFLSREDALKYAIDEGLLSPHDAKFGALTSTLMADSSKPGAAIDAISKQPFYSALEKNVNDISQSKMTGDQWLGTLSNKPGVKPEEMQYTGLQDFLSGKGKEPVTKEEVQQHLANNKVQINDVVKGAPREAPHVAAMREEFQNLNDKADVLEKAGKELNPEEHARMDQLSNELMKYSNPWLNAGTEGRHSKWQLPGGQNYREHLLTLPEPMKQYNQFTDALRAKYGQGGFNNLPLTQAERNHLDSLMEKAGDEGQSSYKSSHWDEPDVIAHMRTNERDVDGVPSLHLEELQSDWHQAGRDKGYQDNKAKNVAEKKYNDAYKAVEDAKLELRKPENWEKDVNSILDPLIKVRDAASAEFNSYKLSRVPDAPFKKSWPELVMKRAIRTAVEDGKSRVSWTPGEAQAARYDLSKHFNSIDVVKATDSDGIKTGNLVWWPIEKRGNQGHSIITDTNGKIVKAGAAYGNVVGKNIDEVLGKEIAEKGLKSELNTTHLTGVDLKVGGEGMKGFYDQMLPKMVERLGKKYGVKVKEGSTVADKQGWHITKPEHTVSGKWMVKSSDYNSKGMLFDTEAEAKAALEQKLSKSPVHYFDIPEKMKQDVLRKGFPLFSNPLPIPNQRNN